MPANDAGESPALGLYTSRDGGNSFAPPVAVSRPGAAVSTHGENSPSLVVRPTEIYALWEQQAGPGTERELGRSLSFGHSLGPRP